MGIFGTIRNALGFGRKKAQAKDVDATARSSSNGEVEQVEQAELAVQDEHEVQTDAMELDHNLQQVQQVQQAGEVPWQHTARNGLSDEWIIENLKGENFEILEKTCTTKHSSLGIVIRVRSKQMVVVSETPSSGGEGDALGLEKGDVIVEIANEAPGDWLPGVKAQLQNASRPFTMKICRFKGENSVLTEVLKPLPPSPTNSTTGRISPSADTPKRGPGRPRKNPLPVSPETQLAIMVAANAGGNTPGRKKVSSKSLKSAKKREAKQVVSKTKTKGKRGKKK